MARDGILAMDGCRTDRSKGLSPSLCGPWFVTGVVLKSVVRCYMQRWKNMKIFEKYFLEPGWRIWSYMQVDTILLLFELETDHKSVKGFRLHHWTERIKNVG